MDTRTKSHIAAMLVCVAIICAFSYTTIAYAAPSLLHALFGPVEWYQVPSMFFRSATNPGYVIPVMASAGYALPVEILGGVSVTIGSTTFTASPVFSDSGGSGTLALVDGNRRIIVTLGSESIALISTIAAITTKLNSAEAHQATETLSLLAAQASAAAQLTAMIADQASQTLTISAAIASTTIAVSATQTVIVSNFASATNTVPTGILGTFTLSIPLSTSVSLPTAPTGATNCKFNPTQNTNYGGATVGSGTGYNYFFQDVPGQGFFGFSGFTSFRLIGQTSAATITNGIWY